MQKFQQENELNTHVFVHTCVTEDKMREQVVN